jgi:hypothetical protein
MDFTFSRRDYEKCCLLGRNTNATMFRKNVQPSSCGSTNRSSKKQAKSRRRYRPEDIALQQTLTYISMLFSIIRKCWYMELCVLIMNLNDN